jgi:YihY family inner membrane protein
MSTARNVPETVGLTGDDARQTLQAVGKGRLLRDAFLRLRYADGFSHSRSLAFLGALVLVQGIIAVVGLASVLGTGEVTRGIVRAIHDVAPGASGRLLTSAVDQARENGTSGDVIAVVAGLVGTFISGTTAMGQLERGLNRIYGIEKDRPTFQKYARAFGLALSAGVLLVVAFLAVGFGPAVGRAFDDSLASDFWGWVRWPVALLTTAGAVGLLFRWCPHRRQPGWSWLAFGSSISVVLSFLITVGMGAVVRASSSFGDTYGPLAGIVALLLWGLLTSIALFFGGSVTAQLEAVRAGQSAPSDAPVAHEAASRPRPAVLAS